MSSSQSVESFTRYWNLCQAFFSLFAHPRVSEPSSTMTCHAILFRVIIASCYVVSRCWAVHQTNVRMFPVGDGMKWLRTLNLFLYLAPVGEGMSQMSKHVCFLCKIVYAVGNSDTVFLNRNVWLNVQRCEHSFITVSNVWTHVSK